MLKSADDLIKQAQAQINCVDIEQAKKLYHDSDSAVIVDVREADSAAQNKLAQSVNISRGLLEMKMPKQFPDSETLVLTHCGGGGRASLAAQTLQQMGYKNVYAITARFEDIKKAFG